MEVREKFEHMGEIKTFFDLISNRGMVFITYVSHLMVSIPTPGLVLTSPSCNWVPSVHSSVRYPSRDYG